MTSMTTVIFHDSPGLKIPFLSSMTFQDDGKCDCKYHVPQFMHNYMQIHAVLTMGSYIINT